MLLHKLIIISAMDKKTLTYIRTLTFQVTEEVDMQKTETTDVSDNLEEVEDNVKEEVEEEAEGVLGGVGKTFTSVLSSLTSSHSALSRNFGSGMLGALASSLFLIFFLVGFAAVSYEIYVIINTKEQNVIIPLQESSTPSPTPH